MVETKQTLISLKDLFIETFLVFKKDWRRFFKMVGLAFVSIIPLFIVEELFSLNNVVFSGNAEIKIVLNFVLLFAYLASLFFLFYMLVLSKIGSYRILSDRFGRIFDVFRLGGKNFWGFVWVSILMIILTVLWTFLLIVPGIIFGVYYFLSLYIFIFENKKGMKAIKRSKDLIKGYWWAFFTRLLLFYLFAILIYWAVETIFKLPLSAFAEDSKAYLVIKDVSYFGSLIFDSFIIVPLSLIYFNLIYRSLVKIKDEVVI
jgi:hypothetical protein